MVTSEKRHLLAIVGPTGVGKTTYAVHLAQQLQAEIISADSRQIYTGMDIATGKETHLGQWQHINNRPTLIIDSVSIHGLNLVSPNQTFSIADWVRVVHSLIQEIRKRGHLPIIVGGTGFYLQGLTGMVATISIPPDDQLRCELKDTPINQLQQRLQKINPVAFEHMNPSDRQNPVRLIRAIEIHQAAETHQRRLAEPTMHYSMRMLGLTLPTAQLYAKVDSRIDTMLNLGLIDETKQLLSHYDPSSQALTGIGYYEVCQYLQNQLTREQAISRIKTRTHAYIRKQNTWWKKQPVTWVNTAAENWQETADHIIQEWLPQL